MNESQKRLFVAMPYKTRRGALNFYDQSNLTEVDFERVWTSLIEPAIPNEFQAKRAEELGPGPIEAAYIDWLQSADIVLADLTFANPNVYYELGIRHVMSPKGTVLVAHEGSELPFDVRNQSILFYSTSDDGDRFRSELNRLLSQPLSRTDSPVHLHLPNLHVDDYSGREHPDVEIQNLRRRLRSEEEDRLLADIREDARNSSALIAYFSQVRSASWPTGYLYSTLGEYLRKAGKVDKAIDALERADALAPNDARILKRLGFAYRSADPERSEEATDCFARSLAINDGDPELHGMMGGQAKRQGDLDAAFNHYSRAYELDSDSLYSVVTMGQISALQKNIENAKKFYEIAAETATRQIMAYDPGGAERPEFYEDAIWALLCKGEALVYFGNRPEARRNYGLLAELDPQPGPLQSGAGALEVFMAHSIQAGLSEEILQSYLYPRLQRSRADRDDSSLVEEAAFDEASPSPVRTKVFISYAHADEEWLEPILGVLKTLQHTTGEILPWVDTAIQAGDDWRERIETALAETKVAIVLVSLNFLQSKFIADEELPTLLEAAESGGATILPVLLSFTEYTKIPQLSRFQAVNKPGRELLGLDQYERDKELVNLANSVAACYSKE